MALGDALRRRMEVLAKRQPTISPRLAEIAEGATLRAVEAAVKATPPNNEDRLRGVHMITGELAQHWSSDSQAAPTQAGGRYTTCLRNNKEYASYVNDGHRMDKHFVPGLYVDDNGLLSYDPGRDAGLMVGTQTACVPGLRMKEAGIAKYEEVSQGELDRLAKELFR